jgi:hypothetical protein
MRIPQADDRRRIPVPRVSANGRGVRLNGQRQTPTAGPLVVATQVSPAAHSPETPGLQRRFHSAEIGVVLHSEVSAMAGVLIPKQCSPALQSSGPSQLRGSGSGRDLQPLKVSQLRTMGASWFTAFCTQQMLPVGQ